MESEESEFQPIGPLLERAAGQIPHVKQRLSSLDRDTLSQAYQKAFISGKRVAAFLLAQSLTREGIPPVFRHANKFPLPHSLNQKFDLFVHDLEWLSWTYPDHSKVVRYRRCKALLSGSPKAFHSEAEYMFYAGRRPYWKMVGSLSLTLNQQHECMFLQSAPVRKDNEETLSLSGEVYASLEADLAAVRLTTSYSNEDLQKTLLRRHRLWRCYRMDRTASLAGIADRYWQMTGEKISRQAVAKQMIKITEAIRRAKIKK